ncbi:MAG TPA: hypothetical protein VMA72_23050 [Streptosporangiaceae bacterium]|nr:hypothetical protein [Streptosporangiaceae bacterium]
MTSAPARDPVADHLITPQNAAFLLIDYQPSQLAGVRSMDRDLLVKNAVSTVKVIKTFDVPIVHSTINVATGRGKPTLPELADLLTDDKPLDRTTTNSWEDKAGGQPISWVSLAVELQRDWARQDTVQAIIEIVLTDRLLKQE